MARSLLLSATVLPSLLLAACQTGPETAVLADAGDYLDREVLVSIDDDADGVARMKVQQEYGLSELDRIDAIGVARLSIEDDRGVDQVTALLESDHRVDFAEPNYIARTFSTTSPDDPYRGFQWNLDQIDAQGAWAHGTGAGVTVAVLDSGVAAGGRDGITNLLSGYDFYYGDADPTDRDGHGTFVAGTIGQRTDNGVGVSGVAPGVDILPVKVMSDQGYGDISAISNGVVWASDQGADVINMSLGSAYPSSTMQRAVDYAYGAGTTVVAATGNEFARSISYPAAYESVIAVGASRYDGTRAPYSNTGNGIDILAPGGDTSVDQNGDGYADGVLQETVQRGQFTYTFWEGTSMASPHVAAAAALLYAQGIDDPAVIYDVLTSTAVDVGSRGYDTASGYGILDVGAAVALAAGASGGATGGGSSSDGSSSDGSSSDGSSAGSDDGGSSGSTGDGSTADGTAPTIADVSGSVTGNQFTIEWITDEPADSYIDFEGYGMYGDDDLTTAHSLSFTGRPGDTYVFDLYSTDAAGNEGVSGTWQISL